MNHYIRKILNFGFRVHNEDDDISCHSYVTWAMHRLGLFNICTHYFDLIGFFLVPLLPTCVISLRFLNSRRSTQRATWRRRRHWFQLSMQHRHWCQLLTWWRKHQHRNLCFQCYLIKKIPLDNWCTIDIFFSILRITCLVGQCVFYVRIFILKNLCLLMTLPLM